MNAKLPVKLIRRKISSKVNYSLTCKLILQLCLILFVIVYLLHSGKLSFGYISDSTPDKQQNQEFKTFHSVHGTDVAQVLNKMEDHERCSPFSHVGFLKIHKTGSSTLFNILARYALKNNISVATPPRDHLCYPNRFSRSSNCMLNPKNNSDMLFNHVILSPEVKKVIPQDSFWFATLRDPVYYYESIYHFLGLNDYLKVGFKRFVGHYKHFAPQLEKLKDSDNLKTSAFGLLEHALGFDPMGNQSSQEVVEYMEKNFDLVIVDRHFDEGLCALRKLLCWSLDDVTYLRQNQRSERFRYNKMERRVIYNVLKSIIPNYIEVYEYFLEKFRSMRTSSLREEATKLTILNDLKKQSCRIKGGVEKPQDVNMVPNHIPQRVKVKLFDTASIDPNCLMMAYPESTLLRLLQLRIV